MKWDEADALRGEIQSAERLAEHAAEVAHAHGAPTFRVTPGPLRARFAAAKVQIREAYETLSREVRDKREPSPAEEWLLDNSHIVEDQIREIQEDLPRGYLIELPRLASGEMRGYPRVYGLCLDYLRHTDGRIDFASLISYVRAYQEVSTFTIGEIWAVPIMLRMGLILAVGALAASEVSARNRARGDAWGAQLVAQRGSPTNIAAWGATVDASGEPVTAEGIVRLLRYLREHLAPLGTASDWVRVQTDRMQTTPEDLIRGQHLRQAADQVSVGNAITSMRAIGALDWHKFFEQTSAIEAALHRDPTGDYAEMDDPSRDTYRHAIEDLARRSPVEESVVATAALDLAEQGRATASSDAACAHIGYYLIGDGRRLLESRVKYRPRIGERFRRPLLAHPTSAYLGSILLITLAALAAFAAWGPLSVKSPAFVVFLLLLLVPASEFALSLTNGWVVAALPPRLLPKLAFKSGVPDEHRTLVVVPALLDSPATLATLLEDLEVRSLANPDENLHFALLTDWTDSDAEHRPDDDAIVAAAAEGISALNAHYGTHRFALLHRRRLQNGAEGCWMGWERKRGKLEELCRLLRGAKNTSFAVVSVGEDLLRSFRYVITLDADTDLPRDSARRLVGAIAHPLNRPRLAVSRTRVVGGHGVIQPRVGTLPLSSRRSRYARVLTGPAGIDPYTTAISDVYQDLFAEGSFVGKGIFDVDAFTAVLAGRVPENTLLSHDLLEGIFARAALATDIEVLDEQPASYAVAAGRQHRWIRGDWQLLPWLRPGNTGLLGLDRWKIVDNLRRSLLGPTLIAFCVASWLTGAGTAAWAAFVVATVFVLPVLARLVLNMTRRATTPTFTGSIGGDLRDNARQAFISVAFLLDASVIALDAIVRTLYRLAISHRQMLEWKTTRQASNQTDVTGAHVDRRMWFGAAASFALLLWLLRFAPTSIPFAAPLLFLWSMAPPFARWLSQPEPPRDRNVSLSTTDRDFLRLSAQKTWRFFDTFVTEADHFLPPDNYQEEPRGALAHRTSPTNIGLYLLSVVAARDFAFLTLRQTIARLTATLTTVEKLERKEGHILNWYETTTLRPLEPQYVSMVDSGNLAAYLWTLHEACLEERLRPILRVAVLVAARDALTLAAATGGIFAPMGAEALVSATHSISATIRSFGRDSSLDLLSFIALADTLSQLRKSAGVGASDEETQYWIGRSTALVVDALDEVRALAPFLETLGAAPPLLSVGDCGVSWRLLSASLARAGTPLALARLSTESTPLFVAVDAGVESEATLSHDARGTILAFLQRLRDEVRRASETSIAVIEGLSSLGGHAVALADGMNFRFLFNEDQCLFAIGYNVNTARLDTSHYDLLASEARLGSLVAIAKGDAPQKHWFRLARPLTTARTGRTLLSWSGSMFEFLMPLLVTKNCPDTLLDETYDTVVRRQCAYGVERSLPWGISESAYNVMDLGMIYQYRAFGVPGLGLKSGLDEDLVIAPYATALAALVRPGAAVDNLRVLSKDGVEGRFGFYESVDYTPGRVPPGRRSVVVKTFMAHHQGMSLVAFGEVLHGAPMQRRFHSTPRVKATELLLEERVPARVANVSVRATALPTTRLNDADFDLQEHVGLDSHPRSRVHLLGQGELSTLTTALGEGFTTWKQNDVTRFREDPCLGVGGTFLYLRNLTTPKLWSAGYQPTRVQPDEYGASFAVDRVEVRRRDGDIECLTEIVVSPEMPVEVRRVTLTNHGLEECLLDVTSYTEVVLAPRPSDIAHAAFGNMFIETELLADRAALLAHRRPKSTSETEIWLAQTLVGEGEQWEGFEFDSARASFLGRNRSTANPSALDEGASLAGMTGTVLDPAFALRRHVRIPPGGKAQVHLLTALAPSRQLAIDLLEKCRTPNAIPRTFELAWSDARVELRHLGISAARSHTFQHLLSFLLFPQPGLREVGLRASLRGRGRGSLWAHGISGDLPILAMRVDDPDFSELLRDVLVAQEFWRINGVTADVVVLNEEPPGYAQPLRDAIATIVRSSPGEGRLDQPGGIFLRRKHEIGDDDYALLLAAARVVLVASHGSLARQLRGATSENAPRPPDFAPNHARPHSAVIDIAPRPHLQFDNGIGGFSEDGREYVMRLSSGARTPAPWCNVIANPSFGTMVSESGSGFTWFGNSQRHRLTAWSNDAVTDPSGETVYLRDEEDGSVWTPTSMPAGGDAEYTVAHGQGYTRFAHTRGDLDHELTVFVSPVDPVKFFRLRIKNRGRRARKLSLFGVVEWVLGSSREFSRQTVVCEHDEASGALLASNPLGLFPERIAFLVATHPAVSVTTDRQEVFGESSSRERPAALDRLTLSGRTDRGVDPCAALQVQLTLAPNEEVDVCLLVGEGEGLEHVRTLLRTYANDAAVAATYAEVTAHWDRILGAVTVKTPDPALDLLVNRWLLYQVTSCRLWGRSAFYQSGGAFGFRDQLQDVLSLLHTRPDLAREHILRAAARQFIEGDVQHWWHPESGEGVRTRCSDDLLWLPFVTAEYVRSTGDAAILDVSVPFLVERALVASDEDIFGTPAVSGETASLYEHCTRALDRGATSGPHGLPLMGGGDWNDGMTRVGRAGTGESVWLAWFLAKLVQDFTPIAAAREDASRVKWCRDRRDLLARAIDETAWDGGWYRRAYFDDGTPLGTKEARECRIDAIAQSWAIVAGVGDPEHARRANDAALLDLVRKKDGLMALLSPPFDHLGKDPGYLGAYPPGIRENGGQYTHGAMWSVQALALAGEGDRANALLSMLNPIHHGDSPEAIALYKVEPYVATADVYTAPGHVGRGGWSWYTGSASWMYRVMVENILGIRRSGRWLVIDPTLSRAWSAFTVKYRHEAGELIFSIENPSGIEHGVIRLDLDGVEQIDLRIDLRVAVGRHEVRVVMGQVAQ